MTGAVVHDTVPMKTMGNEREAALEKTEALQKEREDSLP